jgi:hydroxymethylpyrimidine/phosphomethylpyrimidine kinase
MPAVLVIAATDSSGGAGLVRDVSVLSALGVDAMCVVTAVTAQSNQRVSAVHHVPPEMIREQIAGARATRPIEAIKIGMLGTRATVEAVADGLRDAEAPLVVDPVLVSSSGGVLLDESGRAALLRRLLPLATLVTPNVPEVAALSGEPVAADEAALIEQGQRLLAQAGSRAVLLKGGHADGAQAVDLLLRTDGSMERMTSPRVNGSSRGTGCALASAIAGNMALGCSLEESCRRAKRYVLEKLLR